MRFLIALLFLGQTILVKGQDTDITLKVIDATTKKPIKNVNVIVIGTTKGTFTNALGYCKVGVSSDEKRLVLSHVSFQTATIEIPQNVKSFAVPLEKNSHKLPDIDLTQYPNKFNPTDFDRIPESSQTLPNSFVVVEADADFPYEGGIQTTFREFFGNAFQFPEEELKANKSGTIDLEFTIDKTGDYTNAKCLTDSLSRVCQELKRALTVIPKWKPAKQYDEPVAQTYLMRVTYGPNKYWTKKFAK